MRIAFMSRDRADWLIALSSGCTRSKLQVRGATPALARRRIAHNKGMGQSSLHRALEIRHFAELPGHLLLSCLELGLLCPCSPVRLGLLLGQPGVIAPLLVERVSHPGAPSRAALIAST